MESKRLSDITDIFKKQEKTINLLSSPPKINDPSQVINLRGWLNSLINSYDPSDYFKSKK